MKYLYNMYWFVPHLSHIRYEEIERPKAGEVVLVDDRRPPTALYLMTNAP